MSSNLLDCNTLLKGEAKKVIVRRAKIFTFTLLKKVVIISLARMLAAAFNEEVHWNVHQAIAVVLHVVVVVSKVP